MDNPRATTLDLTRDRLLEVWWAALWRFVVFVAIPSLVGGFLAGAVMAFILGPAVGEVFGIAVLLGASTLLSVPLCKMILITKFSDFSLGLIAETPASGPAGSVHPSAPGSLSEQQP